uniref:Aquaporin n=1 Tax=Aegilops tauschii subsp. strangulata TaxID=200361 RepID=A0A453J6G1_AEGTS
HFSVHFFLPRSHTDSHHIPGTRAASLVELGSSMDTKHADSFDERDVVVDAGCVRAVLGELVLTFLFVFTGVAAAMAAGVPELQGAAMPMATLAGVALAQALAAGVLVTAGFHVSGGHLNPAVTVALLARGHITAFRAVLYVAAQLLASSLACILLRYLSGGQVRAYPCQFYSHTYVSARPGNWIVL